MAAKFGQRPSKLLGIHKSETAIRMAVDVAATYFLFEDEQKQLENLEIARVNAMLLMMGGKPKEPEVVWETVEEY